MIEWLNKQIRFGQLASHWQSSTGLAIDNAAVNRQAGMLMKQHGIRAEDAWLGALTSRIYAEQPPNSRVGLARGLMAFVQHNQKFSFDEEAAGSAMLIAQQILNEA